MIQQTKRVLLAAAFMASAAHASVITEAGASVNLYGGYIEYGYNFSNVLEPLSSNTGFGTYGVCPAPTAGPPAASCTSSFTGTTDTTGNLTAASDSVSQTNNVAAYPALSRAAATASASAFATANMASGSVGVAATGTYLDYPFPNSGQNGGSGSAFAQANDTLHFHAAGASPTTISYISVSFTVNGSMTVPTPAGDSNGSLQAILQLGGATISDTILSGPNLFTPTLGAPSGSGWTSFSVTPTGPVGAPGSFIMNGVYAFTGATADLGIAGTLSAQCGIGTTCDYSHTGTISFTLPSNISYTSDSGVFLTQTAGSAAPEPASFGFAAAGIAGLVFVARKRRRA